MLSVLDHQKEYIEEPDMSCKNVRLDGAEIRTYKLLPASSLIPFPLRFLLGVIS